MCCLCVYVTISVSVTTLCSVAHFVFHFCLFIEMAIIEGPLSKWTNVMQGWQYRWFVLNENVALLSYYTVSFLI